MSVFYSILRKLCFTSSIAAFKSSSPSELKVLVFLIPSPNAGLEVARLLLKSSTNCLT